MASYATRYDDSRTREELGIEPRSLEATFADAIRWLYEMGWISARQGSGWRRTGCDGVTGISVACCSASCRSAARRQQVRTTIASGTRLRLSQSHAGRR